ncbi:MAG TPA: hypothetical protein VGB66_08815 [Longimicrobium sp.]|jgi:hypothetical protein
MNKRVAYLMLGLGLFVSPLAACNDNAEDHAGEAREEAESGDESQAREETDEMNQDLEQGDTTELAD